MNDIAKVQIIGVPIACSQGTEDSWRDAAEWVSDYLHNLFGDCVEVAYFDLFDPTCPTLPLDAQIPVVFINDEVIINGGTISIQLIQRKLEELGVETRSKDPNYGLP